MCDKVRNEPLDPTNRHVIYDAECDVLYIAFADQQNSYGDDWSSHIILRKDWDTDDITGVTILDFKKSYESDSFELAQIPRLSGGILADIRFRDGNVEVEWA